MTRKLRLSLMLLFSIIVFISGKPKDLKKVVLDDLINETQFSIDEGDADAMRLVWWVPTEFWATIYAQDESVDEETASSIIGALAKYTMVIVIDGEMSNFGDLKSIDPQEIRKNIKVTDFDGKVFSPIKEKEIDYEAKMVLNILKPVFSNLLGKMGESMQVFMFTDDGKALLDPFSNKGGINYGSIKVPLDLPLAALQQDKICPTDGALMSAKWDYCPFHGTKLK